MTTALVVEVDRLYASLYGDEAEGQWCRALVVDQQESQVQCIHVHVYTVRIGLLRLRD